MMWDVGWGAITERAVGSMQPDLLLTSGECRYIFGDLSAIHDPEREVSIRRLATNYHRG